MSDETALLRAIAAHPDEDTPRLAYADYVEEHGRPERAAFIRGQIELARLTDDSPRRREVAFHCRRLLDAHEAEWLEPRDAFSFDWGWSRGFVETFTTTPADLEVQDAELFATHPFRRVWLWELGGDADGVSLLPKDNYITALDLIGNNLNVKQLKKLARTTHLPHLRELGLMFNALRDSSAKVLCEEPFFQRLELIRLGANPFSDRVRGLLHAHFGDRVTFAHAREPERLYTIQNDRVTVGHGPGHTQYWVWGGLDAVEIAFFDYAGNLLRIESRPVAQTPGTVWQHQYSVKQKVRDAWLAELGRDAESLFSLIRVKVFRFPNGTGLTPFNWWAGTYDNPNDPQRTELAGAVEGWLEEGQYRIDFGGDDNWFDRDGEVTDT